MFLPPERKSEHKGMNQQASIHHNVFIGALRRSRSSGLCNSKRTEVVCCEMYEWNLIWKKRWPPRLPSSLAYDVGIYKWHRFFSDEGSLLFELHITAGNKLVLYIFWWNEGREIFDYKINWLDKCMTKIFHSFANPSYERNKKINNI